MRLAFFAVAFLCLSSLAARADTFTYTVTAPGAAFSGDVTLTTSNINGVYTITGIMGAQISNLIGFDGFKVNDNILYPGGDSAYGGYLDIHGFSFLEVVGTQIYNINVYEAYDRGISNYYVYQSDDNDRTVGPTFVASFTPVVATPTPIAVSPEPSGFALLGTGVLGMVGLLRKRYIGA